MTRDQLLTEVLERLGDASSTMASKIGDIFDLVLADMASRGILSALRQLSTGFNVVLGQEVYTTQAITGLSNPDYPYDILGLFIPSYGYPAAIIEKVAMDRYQSRKALNSANGQPEMWTLFPNETAIAIWPPASATYAGTGTAYLYYVKPPTAISGSTEISEVRREDLHVLVSGVYKFASGFFDNETIEQLSADQAKYSAHYEQGIAVMTARARGRLFSPRQLLAQGVNMAGFAQAQAAAAQS